MFVDHDGVEQVGVFLRTAYNYSMDDVSKKDALFCPKEEDMAQQQFADECDINTIVRRFGLTGELPENVRVPQYGDFTGISDYKEAMNAVRAADEAFMELPAETRYQFANDPQKLLEFVADEKNREKAVEMGLMKVPEAPVRSAVQALDELSAKFDKPIAKP